jgi:hypothetical protein
MLTHPSLVSPQGHGGTPTQFSELQTAWQGVVGHSHLMALLGLSGHLETSVHEESMSVSMGASVANLLD